MDTVIGITGAVMFYIALDALVGWLLYRWSKKFSPYSKTATIILCFFPLINIWVTFPLMAGKQVGWKDGNTAGAIVAMMLCGPIAWLAVILFWLASLSEMKRRNNAGLDTKEVPTELSSSPLLTKPNTAITEGLTVGYKCPFCDNRVESTEGTCTQCGNDMQRRCPHCRKHVRGEHNKCPYCLKDFDLSLS